MKTFRPVPRLHRKLFNIGLSSSCAADVILMRRNRDQGSHVAYELIRAAFQNRHSLRQQLPGAARYR
jgi:hypothetical protein